jgi:hypothetical protein
LGCATRDVPEEWNGEPAPVDRRGATVDRLLAAAADRLLKSP